MWYTFRQSAQGSLCQYDTGETLTSATGMNDDLDDNTSNTIENNPTHVVLRMLFIDGDEVPDR